MAGSEKLVGELEKELAQNPTLSAQRERTGSVILVRQDLGDGKERVLTIHPIYQQTDQTKPGVAIGIRTEDKDFRTRNFSFSRPEIIINQKDNGEASFVIDEEYGRLDPDIDPRDVIKQTRNGLGLLLALTAIPSKDYRRFSFVPRVADLSEPEEELNKTLIGIPSVVAQANKSLSQLRPRQRGNEFLTHAIRLIDRLLG